MKSLLAALYSAIPRRARSRLIEARLQRFVPLESALRVAVRHETLGPYTACTPVRFERDADILAIGIDLDCLDHDLRVFNMVWKRLPVVVQIVSRASAHVRHARCDLSDGQCASANEIAFCSADPASILVPDRSFMTRRYYEPLRMRAKSDPWNWQLRSGTLAGAALRRASARSRTIRCSLETPI